MHWKNGILGLALLAGGAVQAAPVEIAGHLGRGGSALGAVDADTGPWDGADGWQFWTFDVALGDQVRIDVEPLNGDLDAVFGVWFGTEADTANYFDMGSDSLATTWYGMGDDGPVEFTSYVSGVFTIAVADHALTPGGFDDMAYRVTLAVPEPETYALMLAGLLFVGFYSARRQS